MGLPSAKLVADAERKNMAETKHPMCEWVGFADDPENVALCVRPAYGVIADATGGRHFACPEHLSAVKARYATGGWTVRPAHPTFRHFPEALP